jgi:prevent-host-death family protein
MPEVGAFEAKNKLSALLDQVQQGMEITITRRGRPVARPVPAETSFDRERARRAADDLLTRIRGFRLEVANGLQVALRRGRIDVAYRDATIANLRDLAIDVDRKRTAKPGQRSCS